MEHEQQQQSDDDERQTTRRTSHGHSPEFRGIDAPVRHEQESLGLSRPSERI